jgi:hypothetical protein
MLFVSLLNRMIEVKDGDRLAYGQGYGFTARAPSGATTIRHEAAQACLGPRVLARTMLRWSIHGIRLWILR